MRDWTAFRIVLLLLASPAWAQRSPGPTDTTTATRRIPPSLIAAKAGETDAVLESMADRHGPDPETQAIRAGIAPILGQAEDLLETTELQLQRPTSARQMQEMENALLDLRAPLYAWRLQIQRRARGLDRDLHTLNALHSAWESTLQDADSTLLAPEVLKIARDELAAVGAMEVRFNTSRAELFTVEEQVERTQGVIEAGLDLIESARERARVNLTVLDVPPIWSHVTRPNMARQQWQLLQATWQKGTRTAREFTREARRGLIGSAVFFGVMLTITVRLGRRLRQQPQPEPEMDAAVRILSRPVSAALIAAVLFIVLVLPRVPFVISDIATIVLFLPVFRILPAGLTRHRRLLATLVGMHVLGTLSEVVIYLSPLQQILLLTQGILALAVLIPMLRHPSASTSIAPRSLLRRLQWAAVALVTAAVVADVVGNVSFAAVVMRAVLLTTEVGLLLYAAYCVLQGVLRAAFRAPLLQRSALVRNHEEMLRRRTLTLLRLLLVFLWVQNALKALLLWGVVVRGVRRALAAEAHFGEVGVSFGAVLALVVTIWASFLVSRFLRFVLEGEVYPRLPLPRGVPQALSTGLHYILLLCGFFLAVAATGVELGKFAIIVSAFSVGIGFGLQNVINNFVSGLILMVERPIMAGDAVQIGQITGEVRRIGMRSSTVRTWEGAEVIVPNANLISSEVTNWTKSDRLRRIDLAVGVEYGSDPQRVLELLLSVASQHPDALQAPPPTALFMAFGDSALDFQLRVWTANMEAWMRIKSELAVAVYQALQQAGIGIPFPQRDLHLKSVAPGLREALTRSGEQAPS